MEEAYPVYSATLLQVPASVLEFAEGSGGEDDEERMLQFDDGYERHTPKDYASQELNEFHSSPGMPEFQVDCARPHVDRASDCRSTSTEMLSQAVDAEASLRAEILDLGRRMRTVEPACSEQEYLAVSTSNGSVGQEQDTSSCDAFRDEHNFSVASTSDEAGTTAVGNGCGLLEPVSGATNGVIVPGLRGSAAAAGGPLFCDYLVGSDDDLGLDTPEAIWRPPLMRRPPEKPQRLVDGECLIGSASNGVQVASYPSAPPRAEVPLASEPCPEPSVAPSARKPAPGSSMATPRPRVRPRPGPAAPASYTSTGNATALLSGSSGGGSSASAHGHNHSSQVGSDSVRRADLLDRVQQSPAGRNEFNRGPQGMRPQCARPPRSAEVQALQAEVAMQEVQLRRLLTAQPGENIPDEVAFEAARLWQGLESIRSVIVTLQERLGEERIGNSQEEDMTNANDAGFVEDAYVMKADGNSQGSRGRGGPDGSPDGFDEIARLEAATSILTRQPRSRNSVMADERGSNSARQGAFRGLVRGSGTGGGAGTRVSNTSAVKRQPERPATPLKQRAARQQLGQGLPGKVGGKRLGASQVSSAVNIGVATSAVPGGGANVSSSGSRKSPSRERRSVSAPRGTTSSARRAVSPTPKPQSRPSSPQSGSVVRRTTSPTPKSQSRPTSPRSPRGAAAANQLGGPGRATVHPHTPPPPSKRSPIDTRDNENLARRGGAGTPHSPSSQHSVVVRASSPTYSGGSNWKHSGVAPVVLHGGAAVDHAALGGTLSVGDIGPILAGGAALAGPESNSLLSGIIATSSMPS